MVKRGIISSYDGTRARVIVPGEMNRLTLPLYVGRGALSSQMEPPPVGTRVIFVEFPDGDGTIFGRLT